MTTSGILHPDMGIGPDPRVQVLEFDGRLTFGEANEQRYQELRGLLESGIRRFAFDLRRVPDLDSAGIGFLVTCFTTVLRFEGNLALAAPSNRVLYSLLITRLDTVFPIFETVEAAIEHLMEQQGATGPTWLLEGV